MERERERIKVMERKMIKKMNKSKKTNAHNYEYNEPETEEMIS